jgi:hypothetical protein
MHCFRRGGYGTATNRCISGCAGPDATLREFGNFNGVSRAREPHWKCGGRRFGAEAGPFLQIDMARPAA